MSLSLNKPKPDNLTNEIWKSAERKLAVLAFLSTRAEVPGEENTK